MTPGDIPFVAAIDGNNGVRDFISLEADHPANTITVNYNGSVAEAFYQSRPFRCSDDVNVLYPKFDMTPATGLFLATVIRQEKYRFKLWAQMAPGADAAIPNPVTCAPGRHTRLALDGSVCTLPAVQ